MKHATTMPAPRRGRLLVATALAAAAVAGGWTAPADAAVVHCYGQEADVVGTAASETINASDGVTDGPDVINGLGGNDTIYGLGGDDVICGGDGSDSILGDVGDDKIAGNAGGDWMWGQSGGDHIEGFHGNDTIFGGTGNDRLDGGDGNVANFDVDWGDDNVYGEAGNDVVRGAAGDDDLFGGNGLSSDGASGSDTLYGYAGNDTLRDPSGSGDRLIAGVGNDTLNSRDNPAYSVGDLTHGGNGTDVCSSDANDSRVNCNP